MVCSLKLSLGIINVIQKHIKITPVGFKPINYSTFNMMFLSYTSKGVPVKSPFTWKFNETSPFAGEFNHFRIEMPHSLCEDVCGATFPL